MKSIWWSCSRSNERINKKFSFHTLFNSKARDDWANIFQNSMSARVCVCMIFIWWPNVTVKRNKNASRRELFSFDFWGRRTQIFRKCTEMSCISAAPDCQFFFFPYLHTHSLTFSLGHILPLTFSLFYDVYVFIYVWASIETRENMVRCDMMQMHHVCF